MDLATLILPERLTDSIRMLHRAQQLGRQDEARHLSQQIAAVIATQHPELGALLLASHNGWRGITVTDGSCNSVQEEQESKILGIRVGSRTTTTTTRTGKSKTYDFS